MKIARNIGICLGLVLGLVSVFIGSQLAHCLPVPLCPTQSPCPPINPCGNAVPTHGFDQARVLVGLPVVCPTNPN